MMFLKNTIGVLFCYLALCLNVVYMDDPSNSTGLTDVTNSTPESFGDSTPESFGNSTFESFTSSTPESFTNSTPEFVTPEAEAPLSPSQNSELYCPGYDCGFDNCLFSQYENETVYQPFLWGMDFNVDGNVCPTVEIRTPGVVDTPEGNATVYCSAYNNGGSAGMDIIAAEITINKQSGVSPYDIECILQEEECTLVSSDTDDFIRFICGMPTSCQSATDYQPVLPSQISQLYCPDYGYCEEYYYGGCLYNKSWEETVTNQQFLPGQDLILTSNCNGLRIEMTIPSDTEEETSENIGNITMYCATFYGNSEYEENSFTAGEITFNRPPNTVGSAIGCTVNTDDDDDDGTCTLVSNDEDDVVTFVYGVPSSCSISQSG